MPTIKVLVVPLLLLTGCVTNGDYRRAQIRLDQISQQQGYAKTELDAAKKHAAGCRMPGRRNDWHVEIRDSDPVVLQYIRPSIWANFQVLCANVPTDEAFFLDARGAQESGGIAGAGIIVPRLHVFDAAFQPISGEPEYLKMETAVLRTVLRGRWKVTSKTDKIYIVVASDNQDERLDSPPPEEEPYQRKIAPPTAVWSSPFGKIDVELRAK